MSKAPVRRDVRFGSEWVRDLTFIAFARFSQGYAVTAYTIVMSSYLLMAEINIPMLFAILALEYVFITFLTPFVSFLLDSTRTAIGRRTPYLLVFGVLAPFLMGLSQSALLREMIPLALLYIVLFNLLLFLYSLALHGFVRDKVVSVYENLQKTVIRWSNVAGMAAGIVSIVLSSDVVGWKAVITFAGLLWLVSSVLASLFVVERKEFRVKLSEVDRIALQETFYNSLRSLSLKRLITPSMEELCLATTLSILILIEASTVAAWHMRTDSVTPPALLLLLNFATYVLAQHVGSTLLRPSSLATAGKSGGGARGGTGLLKANMPGALPARILPRFALINGVLYLVSYFLLRLNALPLVFVAVSVSGFLWGLGLGYKKWTVAPGRAERELFYDLFAFSQAPETGDAGTGAKPRFALLLYIMLVLAGVALMFAKLDNLYALLSILSFGLSALCYLKPNR